MRLGVASPEGAPAGGGGDLVAGAGLEPHLSRGAHATHGILEKV